MASIIPGYNYDIFISYRQKDNKGDRWVSEFVDALKDELESTFKEEISVYFDINPHDGLLETHDVDESLKEKLKCLVFIPIISRTYCDPKAFAWEHEFKVFVKQASEDQYGLKVKLPGGNVANRVLPVQIHDLDNEDVKLCESVLGGVLRSVEFIYKEPGVNKPLNPNDNETKNLNSTNYRIQINKTANAIKEIISGLKTDLVAPVQKKIQQKDPSEQVSVEEIKLGQERPARIIKSKLLSGTAIIAILVIAVILAYPRIFKRSGLEKLRTTGEKISVAVMPFQNMTNDTLWNIWQNGIQEILTTSLANTEELKIRQTESVNNLIQDNGQTNQASFSPSFASNVSKKLDANIFIYGHINQVGSTVRINAQLFDSQTEEIFKSFQIDGTAEIFLQMIDSLSLEVRNFLIISKIKTELSSDEYKLFAYTKSPEAFRYWLLGNNAFYKWDYPVACKMYLQALSLDSTFYEAALKLSVAYYNLALYEEAKIWCSKVYAKRDGLSLPLKISSNRIYAMLFETPYEEIKYLKQLQEFDNLIPVNYYRLGYCYSKLYQFDKAIPEFEKALEIYNKWNIKPKWVFDYTMLGEAYHKNRLYGKERKLYKRAEKDFPDNIFLIYQQFILSLTEGDSIEANKYFSRCNNLYKYYNTWSDAEIYGILAYGYIEAGNLTEAEKYYHEALSLEPENPVHINNLAYFLIDKDLNINEGLDLADKALVLSPDNYNYLDTKGWGLFKQGKFQDALTVLQKSWEIRRQQAVYDHEAFLHLEEVEKAIASQKNN